MKALPNCRLGWAVVASLVVGTGLAQAGTIHVSPSGNDAGDGLTWATARRTVQAGLNAAQANDQVWVAAGTYVETITLKAGVALYGGFAGTETDLAQRNWTANETVLDGNQAGSVVTSPTGATAATRIDGFLIRNGNAASGGGICCISSSPTIANNTIANNTGTSAGGGIYCKSSSPTIANNRIVCNSAISTYVGNGGGIHCYLSTPSILNNVISGNIGGGIYCTYGSSATIAGNSIVANYSANPGAGIYSAFSSYPVITNTIIAFNSSGIHALSSTSVPVVRTCCVYGNPAGNYTGGLADPTGTNGNVSADPKLAALAFGNVHIQPDSPCRDAGDDSAASPSWTDLDGQPRTQGAHVDIGADESDGTPVTPVPNVIIRVAPEGSDANDGSSWPQARRSVQAAIDAAAISGGEVWVKAGTCLERISLRPFVHVYGGFAGTEVERSARDFSHNVSVLDGNRDGSVVTASYIVERVSTLDGFTIRNGTGTLSGTLYSGTFCGGGIYCGSASPTIANNTITANRAQMLTGVGGGIWSSASSPVITRNTIVGNEATYGGGIHCTGGSPTITSNTIASNRATDGDEGAGGGIYCSAASATIANNTIVANMTSGSGAGIECSSGSPTITNNTVVCNVSISPGGGISCGATASPAIANTIVAFNSSGICKAAGAGVPSIRSSCVYGNGGSDYSGLPDPTGTNGNVSADPKLAALAFGNVHIQPDSPCRDAGDDSAASPSWTDLDGQPRIQGAHVDIGADESDGTPVAPVPNVIIRVAPEGSDANDGSSWPLARRSVQAAIDAAAISGGEVWVKAGLYLERISLRPFVHVYGGFAGAETGRASRNSASNVTILDGGKAGSVVIADSIAPGISTLDGFTIRNGQASGGGIRCSYASPLIANNTIAGNAGFSGASSGVGGGIYCYGSSPAVINNRIVGNTARLSGGAIQCSYSSPTIAGNTIQGNDAPDGGGIYCAPASSPIVANTIVAFNSSGICNNGGTPALRYNCVFGNTDYNYAGLTDPTGADGNLAANPRFVRPAAPGSDSVWGTADDDYGDLRLLPGSPCIDAGRNADVPADIAADGNTAEPLPYDLLGSPRFLDDPATADAGQGTAPLVDTGAYEYLCGDIDGDSHVDVVDLLTLAAGWATSAGDPGFAQECDLNADGSIDVVDLLLLAGNWGR